jgi:hypothetical protein
MSDAAAGWTTLAACVLGFFVYFLPSFIAYNRDHKNKVAIAILNLFFGWTLIGWVGALIWSCLADAGQRPDFAPGSPVDAIVNAEDQRQSLMPGLFAAAIGGLSLLAFVHWLFG